MRSELDVPLVDDELLQELQMTVDLIIAATEARRSLTQDEIDALLGIPRRSPAPALLRPERQPAAR